MNSKLISEYIKNWLINYSNESKTSGFIIGISGGVDSAVTSTICAQTNKKVILLSMPIRQTKTEFERANKHIKDLKARFKNVESIEINLTSSFTEIEKTFPKDVMNNHLTMAKSK